MNIPNNSKVAVYNNIYGYGFENENLFYRTVNIMANDRYADELFDRFPNVRYLRLNDIMHEIKPEILRPEILNNQKLISYSKIKIIRDDWDNFLEKKLPKKLYISLSYKSLSLTGNYFVGDKERSNNIFLKRNNENIEYIIFPKVRLFDQYNLSVDEFISILGKRLDIVDVKNFNVENDYWYILKIKQ